MAPTHRATIDVESARRRPHREGAVLILLYPADGQVSTVFTVRRSDLPDHAGQVSYPGGRRESGETLEAAALREAEEEIGVDRSDIEVLGGLTPLFIPPSRFIVYPFVAASPGRPPFSIEEREVERILEIQLGRLLDPAIRRLETWEIRGESSRVPSFDVDGSRIWGATAMITSELLGIVEPILPPTTG